jgi:colanic acid/amylovoran biosynthesis glycosyltransferase
VNLEQFPVRHLHDFSAAPRIERLWDRGLRKARIRRHLGYLSRVARNVKAEIIHSHFGDVAWTSLGAVKDAGCKHIVTFYGYDMSYLPRQERWRERFSDLFEKADLVLCEGPHMANCVVALGCPQAKVGVHHLGVQLEMLPFRPRQWRPGSTLRVLIASAFAEKKGIPLAIEALGRLKQDVDLAVTIVGDAHHGSMEAQTERARILATISESGLASRVTMRGFLSHAALIREAYEHDLYLAPSITATDGGTEGGAPVSLIEMAATGMFVVSSRHCDIPSVIIDNVTGFLAAERDVDDVAACVSRALGEHERWPEILAAARKHIEAEFSAINQGIRLAALYEGVACA